MGIPEHVGLLLSSLLGMSQACIFAPDVLKDQNDFNVYKSYSLSNQLMCFYVWTFFFLAPDSKLESDQYISRGKTGLDKIVFYTLFSFPSRNLLHFRYLKWILKWYMYI